jgi:hypothetical protein
MLLRASLTASLLLLLLHPQTARMLLDIGANMNLYYKIGYTSFSSYCAPH